MEIDFDNEENKHIGSIVFISMIVAIIVIAFIFVFVIIQNNHKSSTNTQLQKPEINESINNDSIITGSNLTPDDLDFWDKYPEPTSTPEPEVIETPEPTVDPATDNKHFLLKKRDGTEEYITISSYVQKHEYDLTSFALSGKFMRYYNGDKVSSKIGVKISEEQSYVDFNAIKKAGIQFVMISAGVRGYQSGNLSEDKYLYDNIKRASDASIPVGIYFSSFAINENEAKEEADFLIERLENAPIDYPVCIYLENISNDSTRTEKLSVKDRTNIIYSFVSKIKEAGYIPMIYADAECFSLEMNLAKFSDVDIWLEDYSEISTFPYNYSMWEYTDKASIDGISGEVCLTVSMIDFSKK